MTERACATCGEEIPPPPESTDGRVAAAHSRTKYCSSRCKKRHEKGRLSKAHRLAIASAVAPTLRAARKPRTITTTDAEGNSVRTITDTELALSMLKRADIELSTDQPLGVKPCETCKKPFRVKASNAVRCETCRHGRCPDCSKPHVCLPKPGRSGKCRACWRAKRDADIKARPAKAPCKSCGADLWHAKKHRVRARCVACGHRRKEPTSRACVECAKVVVGYTRRGRCQSCYARLRSATSAREIPPPAEQLGPFTVQGAAICSQSL